MVCNIEQTDHNDTYFIIPNVRYLYKWLMVCKVQTCDKVFAQLRAYTTQRMFFLSSSACYRIKKSKLLFSGEELRG